ncbi:phage tail protein [Escherichia coli]|nr:phage tail protein [Escherichia coli]
MDTPSPLTLLVTRKTPSKTAPLQDAVDLEIATEEEASLLAAWKKYRVLLNRVDTSVAPDIEWPAVPVME